MTGGDESSGFENESGTVPPWPVTGPEPDTDAMAEPPFRIEVAATGELFPPDVIPPKPVSLRDQATALFSETIRTRPGTDDADLAACLQSILDAIDLAVSLRLRSEQARLQPDKWRTP